ncbi:hypothetical protein M406DRAFT_66377 [Cryphonectria parasitica EP155]|uniref:Uncharacterized protein n=1 Tax=Cryphonectria parasitica (strain ATCC 38755 / EP155) TaxID=660469 RepID=A0A9P4YBB5_CRYP1|nr:uncharacterized protein M406DRAFT_66377 [Cryphonectria parasitica EP155]KAF3769916.1 hypothetical protein M406DRAFT_66377 [Cryphonectria parasitica EP155]
MAQSANYLAITFLFILLTLTPLVSSQSSTQAIRTNVNSTQCSDDDPGCGQDGNRTLLCSKPTRAYILQFYTVNYLAHAATTISSPGQSLLATIVNILMALLFPSSGVVRGVMAICSWAKFGKGGDLKTAARAGALCAVVPTHIKKEGDGSDSQPRGRTGLILEPGSSHDDFEMETVPGEARERECLNNSAPSEAVSSDPSAATAPIILEAKQGYELVTVPGSATFDDDPQVSDETTMRTKFKLWLKTQFRHRNIDPPPVTVSSSYSFVKILISILQLCYASVTLYQTRGDQIERLGYAAFGLTAAQYAWMSFVNLLGNLVCPQYDTMFMVDSPELAKLRQTLASARNGHRFAVSGTTGCLSKESSDDLLLDYGNMAPRFRPDVAWDKLKLDGGVNDACWFKRKMLMVYFSSPCVALVPLVIVGCLSGFAKGDSALYERVWTMMWLVFGVLLGLAPMILTVHGHVLNFMNNVWSKEDPPGAEGLPSMGLLSDWRTVYLIMALYSIPAIGGFIVVGQMLRGYETCVGLS